MMPSLSSSMLVYEWRRFLSAAIALGFSAFLIYMQAGLALGVCFRTEGSCLTNARADLWVAVAEWKSLVAHREISKKLEFTIRLHPEVELLQTFWWGWAQCKGEGEGENNGWLIPFDINNNFLCMPESFIRDFGGKLQEPLTVVIDRNGAKKLKLSLGEICEINKRRVKVVGITEDYDGSTTPFVFASQETDNYLEPNVYNADRYDYILLKLKDPSRRKTVRDELMAMDNGKTKRYIVMTPEEMYWRSLKFWLFNEGNRIWLFLISLALLVGTAITNQSLRSAILASMREFAAMRALGVSRLSLGMVVMKQALWLGGFGIALGLALIAGFAYFAKTQSMSFYLPWWFAIGASLIVLTVAAISGLLSLLVLYKTQPAELLR